MIDEYQTKLDAVVSKIAEVTADVEVRGEGTARFVFARGHERSIELSSTEDGVWVEYWLGDSDAPDHECLFHTYEAATGDAINWLGHASLLDAQLTCLHCKRPTILRQIFDHATRSWPTKHWIAFVCSDCGTTSHLRLHHGCLSVGTLEGFPAPVFATKSTIHFDTMSFAATDDGITLIYQSLSWFVPANLP